VLTSLLSLAHEATTRHVQCAEHGEQIHSDALPAWAPASHDDAALAALRTQPAAAIHGHEHCVMASATRDSRLAPCPPSATPATVASAQVAALAPRDASGRTAPVYRTAPKTSPPA